MELKLMFFWTTCVPHVWGSDPTWDTDTIMLLFLHEEVISKCFYKFNSDAVNLWVNHDKKIASTCDTSVHTQSFM